MSLPRIIGLLGRSRSGKDTAAEYICQQIPYYQIVRLSYPLKRAVCCLYDYTMDQVESSSKETIDTRWGKTPRETIQSLTDYMMSYMGHDFFSRTLFGAYDRHRDYSDYIIIPDIRYSHDILEIQKRGGIVIKIERKNSIIKHSFEDHIDNLRGDITVQNENGIDELHTKIKDIITNFPNSNNIQLIKS
jgi:hypothetical protein